MTSKQVVSELTTLMRDTKLVTKLWCQGWKLVALTPLIMQLTGSMVHITVDWITYQSSDHHHQFLYRNWGKDRVSFIRIGFSNFPIMVDINLRQRSAWYQSFYHVWYLHLQRAESEESHTHS